MILTRFSRVTINVAHKYLGLTTEVLRTEKAINEIACHPLLNSFYEGGGLQRLRNKFDRSTEEDPLPDIDYFTPGHSRPYRQPSENPLTDDLPMVDSPASLPRSVHREAPDFQRAHSSRQLPQAGDLLTSAGFNSRPMHRSFNTMRSGLQSSGSLLFEQLEITDGHRLSGFSGDEFDLREEVMACIAKSIGLHQPPLSGSDSVEISPTFSPVGSRNGDHRDQTLNSFGSLSLLETGDDASSVTGSSVLGAPSALGALDNEVEILYFAAGSTLARAGERHPGLSLSCPPTLHWHYMTPLRSLLCNRWHLRHLPSRGEIGSEARGL